MNHIEVRGAKTHNLKNIDVTIPRDQLTVITGLSGSGKSSLAFDTLYAEGQRRYVESLSAYARQFLSLMEKPDVEHIDGLSPAISIEQKSTSHNPRSTVGTITEIYDYLRLLFARVGEPHCPEHEVALEAQTVSQMVDHTLALPDESKMLLLAPVVRNRKGEHVNLFEELQAKGFIRARINGKTYELSEAPKLELHKKHTIEVVVDRFKVRKDMKQRLAESFETALELSDGLAMVAPMDEDSKEETLLFSAKFACPDCGHSLSELEPRLFSFNNPAGACGTCDGLGIDQFFDPDRIVVNPDVSLAGGAIRGWDRRSVYYFHMLKSLAKHYKFDIEKPFEKLSKKVQNIILYGSGKTKIEFTYSNDRGDVMQRNHRFEGVIPNMQRRYHETESMAVRDELQKYMTKQSCPSCSGSRLKEEARHVLIKKRNLPSLTRLPIDEAFEFFSKMKLPGKRGKIAEKILKEICDRLEFLVNVGLEYLSLERSADTLSGGEAQRIRLASQIGAGLVGVMYILDEPSIGLHQRDNDRLLKTLTHLRDLGNTVIVVEHDEEAIMTADHVIDMGPKAGSHGGKLIAQGTPDDIMANPESITGKYLSGEMEVPLPAVRRKPQTARELRIIGARHNNLKRVNVNIPLGTFTCVTGVSGGGKSSLIIETLYKAIAKKLNNNRNHPGPHDRIEGIEWLDKIVDIDQSPIGRTPRSNPATYTGAFTPIREWFAGLPEAKARGYKSGRFSFNVKGGRCEACKGDGVIKIEMHFLPDVYVQCDVCKGKRYNRETLEIAFKDKSISDVLDMTVDEAAVFFKAVPVIREKFETLQQVGLGYIHVGQQATTLSGGEAQRVKLAKELSRRATGRTLYILDEPTTGLHFEDVRKLMEVLQALVNAGNSVLVIEHNLEVIKTADWVVDMGPDGGDAGGYLVAEGTPEEVAQVDASYTGRYLKEILAKRPPVTVGEATAKKAKTAKKPKKTKAA